jgi:hypothetical protein
MAEINHRIRTKGSLDAVYGATGTVEGLTEWWTADTSGSSEVGETIHFRFGKIGAQDMKVTELKKNALVRWTCTKRHSDVWIGTEFTLALKEADDQVFYALLNPNGNARTRNRERCRLVGEKPIFAEVFSDEALRFSAIHAGARHHGPEGSS